MMNTIYKTKYYLVRWRYYQENINALNEAGREQAMVLFKALNKLEKEEIELLASKYLQSDEQANYNEFIGAYETCVPITDEVLATRAGMKQSAYSKKRAKIEKKLFYHVTQLVNLQEKAMVGEYCLTYGRMYLKSFRVHGDGRLFETLEFTLDPSKAYLFDADSKEGEILEQALRLRVLPSESGYMLGDVYLNRETTVVM